MSNPTAFQPGDRVRWVDYHGKTHTGPIEWINDKHAGINDDDHDYVAVIRRTWLDVCNQRGPVDQQLHDALAHADVNVCEILPPVMAYPCTWCQDIGAVCSVTVYWTPDGYAECCRVCAPERIRLALDDSLPAARVTVEIIGGEQ